MKDIPQILLIQPKTGVFSEIKSSPSFPLSLLSAVRTLSKDFQVAFFDQRVESDWKEKLRNELGRNPLCVGITSFTGSQLLHALQISRFVKEHNQDVPIVWGGVHVTMLSENSLEEPSIDIVVRGEGEETFLHLAQQLASCKKLEQIPGISFCKNGRILHNIKRDFVDLNLLPPIPYHLVRGKYLFLRKGKPSMYLETSRGCPYRCAFCYNSSIGNRKWRSSMPSRVIESIEEILHAFPEVGHLSIVDDNYFVDLDRVREICRLMIEKKINLTFQVQGTNIQIVKKLSTEDLALLRTSGCVRLDMGVESGSERVLRDIEKGICPEDVEEVNRKLKANNIEPWFNVMSGFPQEKEEDLYHTVELMTRILQENKKALISPLYCYTPYPGNKLFGKSLELGFVPPKSIDDWAEYGWDRSRLPWISKRKAKELESLYFLSIFIDRKIFEYTTHRWLLWAAVCYRPMARPKISAVSLDRC